jgi:hypothetical protein
MNRIAKRAVTLLLILTMIIGMFPAMGFGVAGDLTPPIVDNDGEIGQGTGYEPMLEVKYGDTLIITEGEDGELASGSIVAVYWDVIGAWDDADKEGYMNETEVDRAGNYEVWLDVPEGVYGDHYVWVKNLDSGDYAQTEVMVVPKVKASPGSGQEEETRVTITGYGFKKDKETVFLYSDAEDFDDIYCESETDEDLNTVAANNPDGDLDNAPIKPGSITIYVSSYVTGHGDEIYDDNGKLYWVDSDAEVGDINYVNGEWELEYPDGVQRTATIDYCYYDTDDANYVWVISTGRETNDYGTVSDKEDVPDADDEEPYEMFWHVYDETGKMGYDDFNVGATITVEPDVLTVGEIMTIRGKGFTKDGKIYQGCVTIERGDKCEEMEFKGGEEDGDDVYIEIDGSGEFRLNVIVPQVYDDKDDFEVIVCDDDDIEADSGDVEVTDLAEVEVDPNYGTQGRTVTVTGTNFAHVRGYDYTIYYVDDEGHAEEIEDVETNGNGEIDVEIRIPATKDGEYEILIEDDDGYISADTDFRIGSVLVLLSEDEAPTGTEIIMTGNGFSENGGWNATFGDIVLFEDENTDEDGELSVGDEELPEWYVPQVEPGTYTITVTDMENGISVDIPFEVTKTTYVELNANDVPNEFNLTFTGYFWAETGGDIDIVLYNDTDYWTLDPEVKIYQDDDDEDEDRPVYDAYKWDDDANFTCYWEIYDSDDLDKGSYMMNITDDEDFLVQMELTIGDKVQSIVPRKSSFAIGEQVAFDIMHSFKLKDESYIKIMDPDGELYWRTDEIEGWEREGPYYWVPYSQQVSNGLEMWLLEDAPLGEWSFSWHEGDDDKLESGTFTVTESPADVLSGKIEDVNAAIGDLQNEIQGVSDDMAGLEGQIADAVSAANAATSAANAAVEAVNAIAQTAGDAAEAAQASSEAADEARRAAGGLTTLVYGAIGASLVAALAAIVSLMQISRRIAG